MSNCQSTWCCEETETPRVRTLFRSKTTSSPDAAALVPATASTDPLDWPGLLTAILAALEAARHVSRDARARLPPPLPGVA